jgi:hypothetical protein
MFQGNFTIPMHQDNERFLLVIFQDQGFDNLMFVNLELPGTDSGAAFIFIFVKMRSEFDFMLLEKSDGGRRRDFISCHDDPLTEQP